MLNLLTFVFIVEQTAFAINIHDDFTFPKGEYNNGQISVLDYNTLEELHDFYWQNLDTISTGPYQANASFTATLESVNVPFAKENERILIEFNNIMNTESYYDVCSAGYVLPDGNSYTLWTASGVTESPQTAYFDITHLSGKQIKIEFSLHADSTYNGDGWKIWGVKMVKAVKLQTTLRKAMSGSGYKVNILKVNTDNFPDAVFVEFIVTNSDGQYVRDLKLSDFELWDNNAMRYGCRRLVQDFSEVMLPVDIMFLIDNSGSMMTPQENVNKAINTFLEGLKTKGDVRAGLIRFGHDEQHRLCPEYGAIETYNGNHFFPLQTDSDVNLFKNEIWRRNVQNGYYEPYWYVLKWAAEQRLDYRQNAQKVFVMIGDETAKHGENAYPCNISMSTITEYEVSERLRENDIQVFVINHSGNRSDYSLITQKTGGEFYDVSQNDYGPILIDMGKKISGRYIMRYCLDSEEAEETYTDEERTVAIECKGDHASRGTGRYHVSRRAAIVRSASTKVLDNIMVDKGKTIPIEFDVISYGNTLDSVRLNYARYSDASFTSVTAYPSDSKFVNGDTLNFVLNIPGETVSEPYVRYYIEAFTHQYYKDGTKYQGKVSSPPYYRDDFAWNIAVNPRRAPEIIRVSTTPAYPCNMLTMTIEMKDKTEQYEVSLHYRIADTPSEFKALSAVRQEKTGTYSVIIPAAAFSYNAVEFFITAKAYDGLTGRYGCAELPIRVDIAPASVISKQYPMDIIFPNRESILMDCQELASGDTIAAYYIAECNGAAAEYLMSTTTWNENASSMHLRVYGDDSKESFNKNGYADGDSIILKLKRDGKDYELVGHNLRYSHTAGSITFNGVVIGKKTPKIKVQYDGVDVQHGDTCNFGMCYTDTEKEITIQNTGCDTLFVESYVNEEYNSFLLNNNDANITIPPGGRQNIRIKYIPQYNAVGSLTMQTNTAQKQLNLNLKGNIENSDCCLGLKFMPIVDENYILVDLYSKERTEATVLIVGECANKMVDSKEVNFNEGTIHNQIYFNKNYTNGNYKLQIISKKGLCEHPFTISK